MLGNPTGGVRQGAIYEGATLMSLALDSQKLANYPGGTVNISAYQIHGRGLSANNLGNLHVASGIEGTRATRLFEAWYEQKFAADKVSVRVGQMSADQEFIVSQYGGLFINASFGWPTLPAVNLPSGGPAYPLATPGVRLKLLPTDTVTVLAGVFNGDPAGPWTRGPAAAQCVGHHVPAEWRRVRDRRGADAGQCRCGCRATGRLQAGRLVQLQQRRRPAVRQ